MQNIIIIGGGIGGLCTALALRRKGFGVQVYETVSEIKAAGAGAGGDGSWQAANTRANRSASGPTRSERGSGTARGTRIIGHLLDGRAVRAIVPSARWVSQEPAEAACKFAAFRAAFAPGAPAGSLGAARRRRAQRARCLNAARNV